METIDNIIRELRESADLFIIDGRDQGLENPCAVFHEYADRNGGKTDITRWSPVNHIMVVNAQELITMSHRRLCRKASNETRWIMNLIRREVMKIDQIIADAMVPMCSYHGCREIVPCYEEENK